MAQVRVVLVRPESPGNLGAVERVVKNTGLAGLDLVSPTDWRTVECWRTAWGAHQVLEQARVFGSLPEALADCQRAFAFTGRRDKGIRCAEGLATAEGFGRDRPVEFRLSELRFHVLRSDPRDLRRVRWLLREGWGHQPHYGMAEAEMRGEKASAAARPHTRRLELRALDERVGGDVLGPGDERPRDRRDHIWA